MNKEQLRQYKETYIKETEGETPIFKINFLNKALTTTNNEEVRNWLKKEQNKQRGIRFKIIDKQNTKLEAEQ